jgi:HSP20 family protein
MMIRRLQNFNPRETIRRQIDQVFDEFQDLSNDYSPTWVPAIELRDTPENLLLSVLLPGIDRNDIDIQVTRQAVSIAGERRYRNGAEDQGYFRSEFPYGKFQRVVPLPVPVQQERTSAEFCDGILTLTLPKSEEYRHRVIKIDLGEIESAAPTTTLEAASKLIESELGATVVTAA